MDVIGSVETTFSNGERIVETPEQFRRRMNTESCPRCQMQVARGTVGTPAHACHFLSPQWNHPGEFASGVDAYFSLRPSRSRDRVGEAYRAFFVDEEAVKLAQQAREFSSNSETRFLGTPAQVETALAQKAPLIPSGSDLPVMLMIRPHLRAII